MDIVSPSVFLTFLIITNVIYIVAIPLYFFRRHKFPIAQRIPILVTIELVIFAFKGSWILTQGVVSQRDSVVKRCQYYYLVVALSEDLGYLILGFRLGWLFFKDFATKALLKRYSDSPDSKGNLVFKVLSFQLEKLGFVPTLVFYMLPVLAAAAEDFTNVASRLPNYVVLDDSACLAFLDVTIICQGFIVSYFLLFGIAVSIGLRRLNDNFSIALEMKALSLPIAARIVFFFVTLKTGNVSQQMHVVSGGVLTPLLIFIQSIYPVWLSIRWEQKKTRSNVNLAEESKTTQMSDRQLLEQVIGTPNLRELFSKFLEAEFAVENLLFVVSCQEFEQSMSSEIRDSEFLLKQLRRMRDTFIVESATSSVNLTVGVRKPLLEALSEKTIENPDWISLKVVFNPAKEEIYKLLTQDSFNRFKDSPGYLVFQSKGFVTTADVTPVSSYCPTFTFSRQSKASIRSKSQPLLKPSDTSFLETISKKSEHSMKK
jgi:hypothetical protein